MFNSLRESIDAQIFKARAWQDVEVLCDPGVAHKRGGKTTGEKRNGLMSRATGEYMWFVDDDDDLYPHAIEEVLQASRSGCDVMAINGIYTEDGGNQRRWEIALGNPYKAEWRDGREVYLRYPNHITPMKRELVNNILFPLKSNFEDKEWADKVLEAGVLKTQTLIEKPLYHYKYSHHNKLY